MAREDAQRGDVSAENGTIASHRFLGGHSWLAAMRGDGDQQRRVVAMLRGAASIDVAAVIHEQGRALPADGAPVTPGRRMIFDVVVKNLRVGHRFPGGTLDAHDTWIELAVHDAAGHLVAEAGAQHEQSGADPTAHQIKAVQAGEDGQPLLAREAARFRAVIYNHTILPLSNPRDKRTQVLWGIRDFESRFGRKPEGMWLPETAMDLETLDVLAEAGIKFTVLAPHQVEIQPPFGQPATVRTSSKHRIAVFAYDGTLSHDVAFGALLKDPQDWLARLALAPHDIGAPICVDIATDGETFGHHHKAGITVLQSVLDGLTAAGLEGTNYSTFLARHPPRTFARVVERTSWSCAHGIERWRSNCGCRLVAGTSQEWRKPLREAFDWLRGEIDTLLATNGVAIPEDPMLAMTTQPMDWHARRMFSSCAWFFDHLDGVEPRICVAHAFRACELAGPDASRLREGLRIRLPSDD